MATKRAKRPKATTFEERMKAPVGFAFPDEHGRYPADLVIRPAEPAPKRPAPPRK